MNFPDFNIFELQKRKPVWIKKNSRNAASYNLIIVGTQASRFYA
ncbi:hypothetical protein LEP1GSC188_2715 [Leptospira weilii serovar Topaz str. LT2116]|uniref:Uncharacterized protein n=1 Tax=Leptospira weilii serovar Topaz str. LT2116 TaxID=1088540 RepID=M3GWG4_9LEPT|nr:hypothetical protein LEP1GSC188_2715 [Leptospira weilii serovar Topaz str. LT2116]